MVPLVQVYLTAEFQAVLDLTSFWRFIGYTNALGLEILPSCDTADLVHTSMTGRSDLLCPEVDASRGSTMFEVAKLIQKAG